MGASSWTTLLLRLAGELKAAGISGVDVYLFGSARRTEDPGDLDVLVVYDSGVHTPASAVRIRQEFYRLATRHTAMPLDISLLSDAEAESSRFVEMEGADLIFSL